MSLFDILAILLGLSAGFGYLNHRYLGLPHNIGLVVMALTASLTVIAIDFVFPFFQVGPTVAAAFAEIDFYETLMHGMLSFLLFAGAMHVNYADLAKDRWAIGWMATIGVLISTFVVGTAMWWVLAFIGHPLPYAWAVVFGALISPTDPVAVFGVLKTIKVPKSVKAKIAGESLFNDGVAVIVFTIVFAVALGGRRVEYGPLEVAELFLAEVVGAAVLGIVAGYIGYRAIRAIKHATIEILITLALVTVTYSVADHLQLSGPIAVVVAGLFIGNHGLKFGMTKAKRDDLLKFWTVTDGILNSILFLLIGLEVLIIRFSVDYVVAGCFAIPIVLLARWISVSLPIFLLPKRRTYTSAAVPALTWGGLRGGISVALALSLPASETKALILAITYSVVVFSIIVQGLTVKHVAERTPR